MFREAGAGVAIEITRFGLRRGGVTTNLSDARDGICAGAFFLLPRRLFDRRMDDYFRVAQPINDQNKLRRLDWDGLGGEALRGGGNARWAGAGYPRQRFLQPWPTKSRLFSIKNRSNRLIYIHKYLHSETRPTGRVVYGHEAAGCISANRSPLRRKGLVLIPPSCLTA